MSYPDSEYRQRERIRTEIHDSSQAASRHIAGKIADLIRSRAREGRQAVLGLATGSTPVGLYRELIRLHQEEGLSFRNVQTFNLDEYYGLSGDHPESYRKFMDDQLFSHVDIDPAMAHVPDGTIDRDDVFAHCRDFEQAIHDAGGIDIQILGIGRTGHIGFNEPGSGVDSLTRLVTLDSLTRRDAARDFLGEGNVPRHAITMGVGTILSASTVYLLAWGEAKAAIVARTVEGEPSENIPATFLQSHPDCTICVDQAAAGNLTRIQHPWLVGPVDWTPETTRKAILWLARKSDKALLKLVEEDYNENGMADLLIEQGPAYGLNIRLFNQTQHTITGWPGGKPNADDSSRPERRAPHPKRSLVLSPEPLDDVYCLGGTIHRLNNQGNSVTIAYQTSGDLAVPDPEARQAIEMIIDVSTARGHADEEKYGRQLESELNAKGDFGFDSDNIRHLKGIIRRGEARSSSRTLGLDASQLRFMNLPFYQKGRYRRFLLEDDDVQHMVGLLNEVRPHQVFATGYGHDPLSVPALCFEVLSRALVQCRSEDWFPDCWIWLYRGPGSEWEAHDIDMAVPLSPGELDNKIQGIYQHQTQRSQQPGSADQRSLNLWNLAREVNSGTARTYDSLGLAEYEAIECFKRYVQPV